MEDGFAQKAIWAYRRMIRAYRNPSIAPELLDIMRSLHAADGYFRSIPDGDLKPDQERTWGQVKSILMRD